MKVRRAFKLQTILCMAEIRRTDFLARVGRAGIDSPVPKMRSGPDTSFTCKAMYPYIRYEIMYTVCTVRCLSATSIPFEFCQDIVSRKNREEGKRKDVRRRRWAGVGEGI